MSELLLFVIVKALWKKIDKKLSIAIWARIRANADIFPYAHLHFSVSASGNSLFLPVNSIPSVDKSLCPMSFIKVFCTELGLEFGECDRGLCGSSRQSMPHPFCAIRG